VPIGIVPVIYDHTSKKILRWYLLDHDYQLNDAAFKPHNSGERLLRITLPIYQTLAGMDASKPLLHKLQDYVTANAP
jgi:hypothetical protein